MISITRPAPAGTFNATPADIEDLIGRTPDPVAALGAQIAQVDVLAGIDLNNVITLPATLTAAKARAFDAKPVPPTTERAAVPAPYANRLEAALDHARRGFDVFPCCRKTASIRTSKAGLTSLRAMRHKIQNGGTSGRTPISAR